MSNWADELTDADRERVRRFKGRRRAAASEDSTLEAISLLGRLYGWEAIRDAVNGEIDGGLMTRLIGEGQRLERARRAERTADVFQAVRCALSDKGSEQVKEYINQIVGDVDHGQRR